jgi:hypothetical protein
LYNILTIMFYVLFRYQSFIAEESERSKTFQFWSSYIDMIEVLLSFIRATRTTNWSLHLSSVRWMLLPWFFAYDRINYAWYLTVYWLEMMSLERTHPGNPCTANVYIEYDYCKLVTMN